MDLALRFRVPNIQNHFDAADETTAVRRKVERPGACLAFDGRQYGECLQVSKPKIIAVVGNEHEPLGENATAWDQSRLRTDWY